MLLAETLRSYRKVFICYLVSQAAPQWHPIILFESSSPRLNGLAGARAFFQNFWAPWFEQRVRTYDLSPLLKSRWSYAAKEIEC